MKNTNPKVDWFFTNSDPGGKPGKWQKEIGKLRMIVLDCELREELKWGCPCYTFQKTNVVLVHVFKEYCALLFFKGALLKDNHKLLIQQTENVQAARQIRFTSHQEIIKAEKILKAYIYEAVEVERAGLKVNFKKTKEYSVPKEFQNKLKKHATLKKAFYALTPGRQRAYLLHFSSAKQSKTREARIEKSMKQILNGKGLEDH